jgi:hypothetical protein
MKFSVKIILADYMRFGPNIELELTLRGLAMGMTGGDEEIAREVVRILWLSY